MPGVKPDHANAGYARGLPKMPAGLSEPAQQAWNFVCKQIPEDRSCPGDALLMGGLVRWFAVWDALMQKFEAKPDDWRLQNQTAKAWEKVEQALRQMGLTLASRARLPAGKAGDDSKPDSGVAKIYQMRQGKQRKPG